MMVTLLSSFALSFSLFTASADTPEGETVTEETGNVFSETLLPGAVFFEVGEDACTPSEKLEDYIKTVDGKQIVEIPYVFADWMESTEVYICFCFDVLFPDPDEHYIPNLLSFNFRAYDFKFVTDEGETIEDVKIKEEFDNAAGVNSFSAVKNGNEYVYSVSPENLKAEDVVPQHVRIYLQSAVVDPEGEIAGYENITGTGSGTITFTLETFSVVKGTVENETPGDSEEETPGVSNKLENWLNETGEKVSDWLNKNTGVALGGTSGLLVLFVGVYLVVRMINKKRR